MSDRQAILEAKVRRLAEAISDGNGVKRDGGVTVDDARRAQRDAVAEIALESHGSVAEVESVPLPSERV